MRVPDTAVNTVITVWAPFAQRVDVLIQSPDNRLSMVPVTPGADGSDAGYFEVIVDRLETGTRYAFSLDGGDPLPDPASRWQPDGVHGWSAIVNPSEFVWTDSEWRGRALTNSSIYELHIGTFTPEGTLDAAIGQLDRLAKLGITTIELMPVNAFPGSRNWGYDGVFPNSVHEVYGGPAALARFVDAAHAHGLAVLLDVVYNHLGPEGNVFGQYGPYFSDDIKLPWGPAINVAGRNSDPVRRFFIDNACGWVRDFHIDGFRFDAVHAVLDPTANPFWDQVCTAVRTTARAARREVVLIGESSDNDPRQLNQFDRTQFDAVWCDDWHHTMRVGLTGDRGGYYADYTGTPAELADTIAHRWHFRGQYSIARGRRHGRPVDQVAPNRFVACTQNHDQVGNRPTGQRPDHLLTSAQRRLWIAALLLSPYTPMLFQGEEYGERRPFPFFVDHTDPDLLRATNEGRRAEFPDADWATFPEPGDPATFESAKLDPSVVDRDPESAALLAWYTRLFELRRDLPALADPAATQHVELDGTIVRLTRTLGTHVATVLINFSADPATCQRPVGEVVLSTHDISTTDEIELPPWSLVASSGTAR